MPSYYIGAAWPSYYIGAAWVVSYESVEEQRDDEDLAAFYEAQGIYLALDTTHDGVKLQPSPSVQSMPPNTALITFLECLGSNSSRLNAI